MALTRVWCRGGIGVQLVTKVLQYERMENVNCFRSRRSTRDVGKLEAIRNWPDLRPRFFIPNFTRLGRVDRDFHTHTTTVA